MAAVLYAFPASHPCAVVERALQLKDVPYRRVDMLPGYSLLQRARFGGATVPGVVFDGGARVIGSRAILRALEERAPEPPLLPADAELRMRVERAEEWGDQVLQPVARRVVWAALRRSPGSLPSYSDGSPLPIPRPVARLSAPLTARWGQARNGADDATARADLGSLPFHLGRVDRWIEEGVIGGESANAADLQIGASLALLLTLEDLGPLIGGRPAAQLARRWFAGYPGSVPAGALPVGWVPAPTATAH